MAYKMENYFLQFDCLLVVVGSCVGLTKFKFRAIVILIINKLFLQNLEAKLKNIICFIIDIFLLLFLFFVRDWDISGVSANHKDEDGGKND